jgi:hypothetical protein
MKSIVVFSLILLLSLCLPGHLAAEAEKTIALAGTTWSGKDSDGDFYVYTFERDGTLAYKSPTGSFRNGTWKQFGGALYMETLGHFSEYLGEIRGNVIEGKAWNKDHRFWSWKASKNK